MSNLKGEIKLGQYESNKDDYWIYDDNGLICGSLGVNEDKVKEFIEEINFRLPAKPVNRGGYPEDNRDTCDGQCPNCMSYVRNITPRSKKVNYCQDCGQAIDWNVQTKIK